MAGESQISLPSDISCASTVGSTGPVSSAGQLSAELAAKRDALLAIIASYETCAVAFSAGIDSTLVAKAAQLALGERAVAVTGVSASLASGELEDARRIAAQIGIRHLVVETQEFAKPDYLKNAPDRCFHCKDELYQRLAPLREQLGVEVIANGANVDDLGDYRPGMQAATIHGVRSPLADCGFTKTEVRALAAFWGLPTWDKPASPCLSSRVAYGQAVTPERLAMIDAAEQFLKSLALGELRVRYHEGDMARVEVPTAMLPRLCQPELRGQVVAELRRLGFKYVTLDLEGFRSGSNNAALPLVQLAKNWGRNGQC